MKDEDKTLDELTAALLKAAEDGTLQEHAASQGMPPEVLEDFLKNLKAGNVELSTSDILDAHEELTAKLLDVLSPAWRESMEAGHFWVGDLSTIDEFLPEDGEDKRAKLERLSNVMGTHVTESDKLSDIILRCANHDGK